MLKKTVIGFFLVAALVAAIWAGSWFFRGLLVLASLLAMYEIMHAFEAKNYDPVLWPGYIFALLYPIVYALGGFELGLEYIWLLLVLCIMFIIIERIFSKKRTTIDAFISLTPFVYPMPFFICILLLSELPQRSVQLCGLTVLFLCTALADTFAYYVGTTVGKKKLCPHISPNKTVEGSVASVTAGFLGGVISFYLQRIWGGTLEIYHYLLLGGLCGVFGQVGDLFASSIKRGFGIKDFGTILPGHGGILDRVDSILLCAPIVYTYFYVFVI